MARVDLNDPAFQKELFSATKEDQAQVLKTCRKLTQLDWPQIYRDPGLKWEQISGLIGCYSLRVSQSFRAIVTREGEFVRFISLHKDHDSAYGRK